MNRFADLLDRLAYEPRRNAKIRLLADYFAATPDPERGYALAAMTGALSFKHAKAGLIRALIAERVDPVLFGLSYDYVGDLSETVALLWEGEMGPLPASPPGLDGEGRGGASVGRLPPADARPGTDAPPHPSPSHPPDGRGGGREPPSLSAVVEALRSTSKTQLPKVLAAWLDALDEKGRWALLKLITGALRIGVSARLAKTAVASLSPGLDPDEVELVWHGLAPPYLDLFAWVEGRGAKPTSLDPAPFRPPMLAQPMDEVDFDALDPAAFVAEWKWDGIRVQAARGRDAAGRFVARLFSRAGEDISAAFPDVLEALDFEGALDGELLVVREGRVQSFNVLQQRLNRKTVSAALLAEYPAHIRAYDLLSGDGEDLRERPFLARRERLARLLEPARARLDLSPLVPFETWEGLAAARAEPAAAGGGADAEAIEGLMVKRADSPYVPGRPKGLWFKWKREPMVADCVLMYAQRGHGKRSSFYSDFTFGVWKGEALTPVGKSYFGFTDAELVELDRFVKRNTINRFGPVREVAHSPEAGLVLEIAFEGLQRSTRHKSGLAMRFPRIARIRLDKRPADADRIETLEAMLKA